MDKQQTLATFRQIPGVGKSIAQDFWEMGLTSLDELKGADPEVLYNRLCDYQGKKIDRCMLYVFRCAVYYASNTQHDPDLLKWWNWSDAKQPKAVNT